MSYSLPQTTCYLGNGVPKSPVELYLYIQYLYIQVYWYSHQSYLIKYLNIWPI